MQSVGLNLPVGFSMNEWIKFGFYLSFSGRMNRSSSISSTGFIMSNFPVGYMIGSNPNSQTKQENNNEQTQTTKRGLNGRCRVGIETCNCAGAG
jgi:hypothetical protein